MVPCGCEQRLPLLGGGEARKGGTAGSSGDPVLYRRGSEVKAQHRCGEIDPGESAVAYEELLRQHVPAEQGMPRLDCALLGMGDDGHTASLFPGSPLLAPEALRSGRLTGFAVAEHLAPKPESRRITLTLEMINAARCCLYLATGEGKRPPLGKALDLLAPASLPVQLVRPKGGELIWVMDEAACGGRQ